MSRLISCSEWVSITMWCHTDRHTMRGSMAMPCAAAVCDDVKKRTIVHL